MNHFEQREGKLWCEGVDLEAVAHEAGTPVYVYSTATIERHFRVFGEALAAAPADATRRSSGRTTSLRKGFASTTDR